MKARRVDDAETIHWTCPIDKSTMFTTQLPIDHWSEVIADSVIADAIPRSARALSNISTRNPS
jgi:hypothetical protein